jgi:hypothetical protein
MSVLHGIILLQRRQTETHTASVSALDLWAIGGILEITHLLDRTGERLLGSGEDGLFYGGKGHLRRRRWVYVGFFITTPGLSRFTASIATRYP